MGIKTGIDWTDHTFNPWWGCIKVSPGCKYCYAERESLRFTNQDFWGLAPRKFFGKNHWDEPLAWDRAAAKEGKQHLVFCLSMGDVFEDRPDLYHERRKLFQLINDTPHLEWQLLTKRPENISAMFVDFFGITIPRNIWLGVSAENQRYFDERWPILEHVGRKYNVKVLFLSIEPLLAPIDLSKAINPTVLDKDYTESRIVNWVITGGESGKMARPVHPAWFRSLRDQCASHHIPFFFKQWGEWYPCALTDFQRVRKYKISVQAGDQWMAFIGKARAGSKMDGKEIKEFPEY